MNREEAKDYHAEWYRNNKDSELYRNKLRHRSKFKIVEIAKDKPCTDCGVQYHKEAMEFDHVRGVKRFNISQAVFKYGIDSIIDEISKCEVVCANCHRVRTYNRRQSRMV